MKLIFTFYLDVEIVRIKRQLDVHKFCNFVFSPNVHTLEVIITQGKKYNE